MKKITLLVVALAMGLTLKSQIVLTGSDNPELVDGGVFCAMGNIQDLDAFRSFVLEDFGINNDFIINTVQYAAGPGSLAGAPSEGLTVTITVFTTDAPFPTGTLTEIASTTDVLFDGDGGILRNVPIEAVIPAGSEVVLLTQYPNDGVTNVTVGSGGSNINGNQSWLRSIGCLGNDSINDLANFNLSNAWTLNAIGDETLSVNDQVLVQNISLFPNPTNGDLSIELGRDFGATSVTIINVSGQNVLTSEVNSFGTTVLQTTALATGVYFAQVVTEQGAITIKFVKN